MEAFARPAFTPECGREVNPLSGKEYFGIYVKLREVLFRAAYPG